MVMLSVVASMAQLSERVDSGRFDPRSIPRSVSCVVVVEPFGKVATACGGSYRC
jgi:hypothetical protein